MKITQTKKGTIKSMPPFTTLKDETDFWDTHVVTDDIGGQTRVGFHKAKKTGTLTVRFEQNDLQMLREKAFKLGIGPTTLVRMWLKEHLAY